MLAPGFMNSVYEQSPEYAASMACKKACIFFHLVRRQLNLTHEARVTE